MNWGLFLGCKVKCGDYIYKLSAVNVENESLMIDAQIIINGVKAIYSKSMSDCKPILRPLSDMTEEEKAEFAKNWISVEDSIAFPLYLATLDFYIGCEYGSYYIYEAKATSNASYPIPFSAMINLVNKFYVGQCKEDECIIEGGVK